ncbi:hypothetical protein [Shewanella cyperi]|uniref:Uncharacterized protein n=1 Tax=Shewanella cyperi TaxID=2814292 RepID=A0A974XSR6_9GAMM|nr:hypothetical protein [Shewanella cyperi]QSX29784.1 hypothetical protein JYB88_16610 [Shewanella cyperi]QSX40567.1 hypothetical protein JYB84_16700 [Shewanella cyperi]
MAWLVTGVLLWRHLPHALLARDLARDTLVDWGRLPGRPVDMRALLDFLGEQSTPALQTAALCGRQSA